MKRKQHKVANSAVQRLTLAERLARMTPEELREALRATAEGDRRAATYLARIDSPLDDMREGLEILEETWDCLVAAQEELDGRFAKRRSRVQSGKTKGGKR